MQNVNIKTNYLDIANCKILLLHNKRLTLHITTIVIMCNITGITQLK